MGVEILNAAVRSLFSTLDGQKNIVLYCRSCTSGTLLGSEATTHYDQHVNRRCCCTIVPWLICGPLTRGWHLIQRNRQRAYCRRF